MLAYLTKKRLSEDKLANIFVNSHLRLADEAFPEVAQMIHDEPEFDTRPQIDSSNSDAFLMILLCANLQYLPKHFKSPRDIRLITKITEKFARACGMSREEIQKTIAHHHSFFNKINHPSKNMLYAMSKAMFYKYNLNQYQQEYFRNINAPNPLFLKRLDSLLRHFIWDWADYRGRYHIVE